MLNTFRSTFNNSRSVIFDYVPRGLINVSRTPTAPNPGGGGGTDSLDFSVNGNSGYLVALGSI